MKARPIKRRGDRPSILSYKDLRNGDKFIWKSPYSDTWGKQTFLMVNKNIQDYGQVIELATGRKSYFSRDANTQFMLVKNT